MHTPPELASARASRGMWRLALPTALIVVLAAAAWAMGPRVIGPGARPVHAWLAPAASINPASGPPSFADIVEAVRPAVAGVQATAVADSSESETLGQGPSPHELSPPDSGLQAPAPHAAKPMIAQGSAFFISADGYAVTNNHVVEGSSTAELQTDDKRTYTAKVVGSDPVSDIALLKVDGRTDFAHVTLSERIPRVGDWVLAVGNPFGLGGTVTAGIISARDRDLGANAYDGLIQIDAPVNKGDSGGPSFDLEGRVIGVNTIILSPSGGSIGIAFAIPAETVMTVVAQLKDKGKVTRGWLGVQMQPLTPELAEGLGLAKSEGTLITEADPSAPAGKAGIAAGDVVVSVDGQPTPTPRELSKAVAGKPPGASLKIELVRQGEQKSVAVTLAEMPDTRKVVTPEPKPKLSGADLGLTLVPASTLPGGGEGLVITNVDPNTHAADRGFEPGDIIIEVAGRAVHTPDDVQQALKAAREAGKRTLVVRLKSGPTTRFVALPIEPAG